MKLILHIVRKDLRRLRTWLLLWGVLLVLPILLAVGVAQYGGVAQAWQGMEEISPWFVILQVVFGYLLVVLLVQEDPVVGTRQFWATRPVSGGTLLAAKALAAVTILWGSALLVGLPWWWWCGWGVAEILRGAVDYGLLAFAIGTPALIIGALTGTLARALLWSPVLLAVLLMWGVPLVGGAWGSNGGTLFLLRTVMAVVATWLLLWVALAGLYRTWWKRKSFLAWGAVGLVVWFASAWTPVEMLFPQGPQELRPQAGAAVNLTFESASVNILRAGSRSTQPTAEVRVWYSIPTDGFAETESLLLGGLGTESRWSWGEQTLSREGYMSRWSNRTWKPVGYHWLKPDEETQAWRKAELDKFQASRPKFPRTSSLASMPPQTDAIPFQTMHMVPASFGEKMTREPARFEAKIWLGLARPAVRTELPLTAGRSQRGDAQRVFLRYVYWSNEGPRHHATIVMTDYLAQSWSVMLLQTASERGLFRTRYQGGYMLLNPETKEVAGVSRDWARTIHIHGVAVSVRSMNANLDRLRRGETFVDRPGWKTGASLAYVEMKPESVFSRDVKVEEFKANHYNMPVDASFKK